MMKVVRWIWSGRLVAGAALVGMAGLTAAIGNAQPPGPRGPGPGVRILPQIRPPVPAPRTGFTGGGVGFAGGNTGFAGGNMGSSGGGIAGGFGGNVGFAGGNVGFAGGTTGFAGTPGARPNHR